MLQVSPWLILARRVCCFLRVFAHVVGLKCMGLHSGHSELFLGVMYFSCDSLVDGDCVRDTVSHH